MTLLEAERRCIQQTLTKLGGNVCAAARALGISRRSLYYKMAHHKIVPSASGRVVPTPKRKLTAEQACAISTSPRSAAQLAAEYGVSRTTITDIRKGRLWRRVTGVRPQWMDKDSNVAL